MLPAYMGDLNCLGHYTTNRMLSDEDLPTTKDRAGQKAPFIVA